MPGKTFNAEKHVSDYRDVMAKLDSATTRAEKAKLGNLAAQMRLEWVVWQGEDTLHERLFGEPPPTTRKLFRMPDWAWPIVLFVGAILLAKLMLVLTGYVHRGSGV